MANKDDSDPMEGMISVDLPGGSSSIAEGSIGHSLAPVQFNCDRW